MVMNEFHSLTVEGTEKQLKTDIHTGLTQSEANKRLKSDGLNNIVETKKHECNL